MLAGILVSIACRSWGNLKSNLLNRTMLVFILFDLCCLIVLGVAINDAMKQTRQRLEQGMQELYQGIVSQLRYMMRRSAMILRNDPNMQNYSSADLSQLATGIHIDEINILDKNGLVVQSNKMENLKNPTKREINTNNIPSS